MQHRPAGPQTTDPVQPKRINAAAAVFVTGITLFSRAQRDSALTPGAANARINHP